MTMQLSLHKVRRILREYFRGLSQTKIANQVGANQSSISHYTIRFKKMAVQYGIPAAGEEYGVKNEVDSLRSLSVELCQSKLTVEDARKGTDIVKAFLKLGIGPEKYIDLIKLCKKIDDPSFTSAALKLSQIETKTGMSYQQVMSGFEKAVKQLPDLETKVVNAKEKLKAIDNAILKNKQELNEREEHLKKYENLVKVKESQLEKELSSKMEQLGVGKKEAEEVAALKTELIKKGMTLQSLLKLGKEFQYGCKRTSLPCRSRIFSLSKKTVN
jgi:predicted transcriptional regulator/uncharacterized protein YfkK (UPF0435 family)